MKRLFVVAACISALLVGAVALADEASAKKEMPAKHTKAMSARYLLIVPHTAEECVKALDSMQAAKMIDKFDFGCMAGDHTGYAIVTAASDEAALNMVPADQREKARAVTCASNLREIGIALHAYSQDYDEEFLSFGFQDLILLRKWQDEHPDERLYFCYFGTVDPGFYGIKRYDLPGGWPWGNWTADIQPNSTIAMSATNLQGVYLPDQWREAYTKLLHDRESKTGAPRLGGLVEPIEDSFDPLRCDPGAGVAHLDRDSGGLDVCRDAHGAAGRRIAQRVGDQVREDFSRANRVGVDQRQAARHVRLERHARRLGLRRERLDRLAHEHGDVDRLAVESERTRLGKRERA